MIIRGLDSDGDWQFGHGTSSYLTQVAAIGLNVETRLLSWVNDCFFDTNAGVDWVNRLGSKNQRALLEADIRRIILTSYGVTGITNFATTLNGRAFSVSCSLNTIYGQAYKLLVNQNSGVNPNA